MVLNSSPVEPMIILYAYFMLMVKLKTSFSFAVSLEFQQVMKTIRTISKVLRVATETIRTRYRKIT